MFSSCSGKGGEARLTDLCGISLGSIGVPMSVILGGKPPIGVSARGTDKLLGVAIDEGMGPDAVGSRTWPPISWWVGSCTPNGVAWDD